MLTRAHRRPARRFLSVAASIAALGAAGASAPIAAAQGPPRTAETRLHPELRGGRFPASAIAPSGAHRLYVRFLDDVDDVRAREILSRVGATITAPVDPLVAFEVLAPPGTAQKLAGEPSVLWIRRGTPPMQPANDGALPAANISPLHGAPYFLDGTGTIVGVWDEGHPHLHVDFASRTNVLQMSFASNHSTHVIGTLAGDGSGSAAEGGTPLQWRGAAFGSNVVVNDYDNPTNEYASAISVHGISLANNSWVLAIDEILLGNCDAYGDYDFLAPQFDALARTHGDSLVIVFAAGNERNDGDCGLAGGPSYVNYGTVTPPATAKNVLSVGAVNSNDDSMTEFSSWGPTDDGRVKPDLVAPGCQAGGDLGITSTKNTTEYGRLCGTSMAAPTVTGALALLDEAYRNANAARAPGALLRALLLASTRDLGLPGPDYQHGFGMLDAEAAVGLVETESYATGAVAGTGSSVDHVFHVNLAAGEVRVTLVWDDPAAADQSSPAIVNDLDLVLVDPNGVTHDPWVLNPGLPATAATRGTNFRDTVEEVLVDSPIAGEWIARVSGASVSMGPQPYALAGTTPDLPCIGLTRTVPAEHATIQAAIDASSACDTVLVQPGTYAELLTLDEAVVLRSADGPAVTVLEPPFPTRIMTVTAAARVEGFTIRKGRTSGSGFPSAYGGAVLSTYTSPEFVDCRFRLNQASQGGGAVASIGGMPRFVSCDFDSNFAAAGGGALHLNDTGDAHVIDCLFHHNEAQNGGALAVVSGRAHVLRATMADNVASASGGAVYVSAGDTTFVTSSIFARNTALTDGGISCAGPLVAGCNDHWMNVPADASCPAGPDDIAEDPLFCERTYGDYVIDLPSPAHPDSTPPPCGRLGAREPSDCTLVSAGGTSPLTPTRSGLRVIGPNPLRRGVRVAVDVATPGAVHVAIYDAGGRRITTLLEGDLGVGRRVLAWDARDARGASVAPGVYFVRSVIAGAPAMRKLVVIR